MRDWIIAGSILLLLSLAGILLVPFHPGPGLPTPDRSNSISFFPTNASSLQELLKHLFNQFPLGVLLLTAGLFTGGIVVHFLYESSDSNFSVTARSPLLLIGGTVIWLLTAFEGGFLILNFAGNITNSPLKARGFAGLGLQVMLLAGVLLVIVAPGTEKGIIHNRLPFLAALRKGVLEYLRAYPYLLTLLLLNEWLTVRYLSPEVPNSYRLLSATETPLDIFLLFGLVSVIAPVVEELFFRGLFYTGLRGIFSVPTASVLGGGCFALIHFETQLVLPLWLFGTILCLVYEWSASIKVVIIMHFLQNTISFLMINQLIH